MMWVISATAFKSYARPKEDVMSNSSRKVIALLLVIFVVLPLIFTTLIMFAINSWVLDRNFYVNLLDNPKLYEALLSQDLPMYVNNRWFPREINSDLPPAALDKALREVLTPQYLRDQSVRIVNEAFDTLEGRRETLDISMDIAPVKAALRGEGGARFAQVLAAQLPACAAGQEPLITGSTLIRCRASNVSVDAATQQIIAALPAFIDQTPDQISLSREQLNLRAEWRPFNLLFLGSLGLSLTIGLLLMVAGVFWLAAAFIGGTNRRERMMWLGCSLLIPAALVLIMGLAINSPFTTGSIGFGLERSRYAIEGVQYSAALRQAIVEMASRALAAVAGGFLIAGGVSTAMACGLLVWGAVTRSEPHPAPAVASTSAADVQKTA
jgi:uncharacterized membrane protein